MKINRSSITIGKDGHKYRVEIFIEEHTDLNKYPEGVKAIFRLVRLDVGLENKTELVILIDNHRPFGFHSHDELPCNPEYRRVLHISHWQDAWRLFQKKCQEILK